MKDRERLNRKHFQAIQGSLTGEPKGFSYCRDDVPGPEGAKYLIAPIAA